MGQNIKRGNGDLNIKYFKYPFYDNIVKKEYRVRFKNLDKRARFNVRKNIFLSVLLLILYIIFVSAFIFLIRYLVSIIDNKVLETLMMIGMIILTIVVPIAGIAFIYSLIEKHVTPSTIGELSLKNIQEITKRLRTYYRVDDLCLITKCYKSRNEAFNGKDVIIFLYKNRVRITLDFYHTIKDFGCYEFSRKDIDVSYVKDENKTKTLIKAKNVEFYLGEKAKPFIRKCFESSKCPCCGNYTFNAASRGMFDICPVCYWEDDLEQEKDPTFNGGANKVSLIEARENYRKFGACEKGIKKHCRSPKKNEKYN